MSDYTDLKNLLNALYHRYNRRRCALKDPVSFLYPHTDVGEREVVGLIAAALAYGRLAQIMSSVQGVLARLGPSPREFILSNTAPQLRAACRGFVHRTANAEALWRLLLAVKRVLKDYGSLRDCFLSHDDPASPTVLPGLGGLAGALRHSDRGLSHLIADPARGSACKRWNLYLRWMVRRDAVDPGGWDEVSPSRLLAPLDTHTWRLWRELGLTQRKTLCLKAAVEVTDQLRKVCPGDPTRYDFALVQASMHKAPELERYLARIGRP